MEQERGTRNRILLALAKLGSVDEARELERHVALGAGEHSIVHQLWRLQKAGLVEFRERKQGGKTLLVRIRLTRRGRAAADRLGGHGN